MSSFKETLDRVNNSPAFRATNVVVGVAAVGFTIRRFHKNPSVWTALPMARMVLAVAESFKPREMATLPDTPATQGIDEFLNDPDSGSQRSRPVR